ncbi:MAG TPA: hypothetical protein VME45_22020 [Stellaceae bacterium]|nr:hypothetical protein [Stellaceae bacterium]
MDEGGKNEGAKKYPILRAKPIKGPIDPAALSREHMVRYPKIRAALALAERRCAERRREDEK